jgi:hypothetical protein
MPSIEDQRRKAQLRGTLLIFRNPFDTSGKSGVWWHYQGFAGRAHALPQTGRFDTIARKSPHRELSCTGSPPQQRKDFSHRNFHGAFVDLPLARSKKSRIDYLWLSLPEISHEAHSCFAVFPSPVFSPSPSALVLHMGEY